MYLFFYVKLSLLLHINPGWLTFFSNILARGVEINPGDLGDSFFTHVETTFIESSYLNHIIQSSCCYFRVANNFKKRVRDF